MTQQTTHERMAELAHDVWVRWMKYMLSKCVRCLDGSIIIPVHAMARWQRQIDTAYADLPPDEKQSDRVIAQEYMACAEIATKDKRIAELEQLFALNPIKVGDISVTLGVNETGEWRMTFDGADDAKLAVVAGMFSTAMQAVMESAK